MRNLTREELLELSPSIYLADGFVGPDGVPRRELLSEYATAAATQLLAAELSPQEFSFTHEALRQSLALHKGAASARMRAALDETLETVCGMIRQPNNAGLTKWLNECAAAVKTPADINALLQHCQAVLRQYSLIVTLRKQ